MGWDLIILTALVILSAAKDLGTADSSLRSE
jgi:hypothetical protein